MNAAEDGGIELSREVDSQARDSIILASTGMVFSLSAVRAARPRHLGTYRKGSGKHPLCDGDVGEQGIRCAGGAAILAEIGPR
jgi:hypothetical protein